jgi:hypothetical protein
MYRETQMFCSQCGLSVQEHIKSCAACGAPLTAGSKAKEKAKVAMLDAWGTFKLLAKNPVGGLKDAFDGLGSARALGAGVAFGAFFALCFTIGVKNLPFGGYIREYESISAYIRTFIVGIIPFLTMTLASFAATKVASGQASTSSSAFTSGVALIPLGVLFIFAALLGRGNLEVILAIFIVALCLTIITLYAGLTRICAVSDRAVVLCVPSVILLSAWLAKVVYLAVF